jgi:hypothetical protein
MICNREAIMDMAPLLLNMAVDTITALHLEITMVVSVK